MLFVVLQYRSLNWQNCTYTVCCKAFIRKQVYKMHFKVEILPDIYALSYQNTSRYSRMDMRNAWLWIYGRVTD